MLDLSDVRFALRLWRRHPTLVIVASLSLGLGIGATTTMFSAVNRVAGYELGFQDEDRLVTIWNTSTESGNINQQPVSWEIVQPLLERQGSFEAIGMFQPAGIPVTLSGTTEATRVRQTPVNVDGLAITGVAPLMGRTYRMDDFEDVVRQKEARSIVISYDAWQQYFEGSPDVIGRALRVDSEPRTVIGVMPRGFSLVPWLDGISFWAATDLRPIPYVRWLMAVGRLKPGASLAAAEAEVAAVTRQVLESRGEKPDSMTAKIVPLHEQFFGGPTSALTLLLGSVSFVLLIGCANVANLLLAAGAARQREFALRAATGAGRRRLIRQLLTENLMLSLVGGTLGLLLAFAGVRLYALIVPDGFPSLLRDVPIDARVLGFALAVSVASSVVFGLWPALRASRVDLSETLKEGTRTVAGGRRRGRNALLVAEVGLSMVLLVGAGLMLQGLTNEQRKLPGFDTRRLLTADILLGGPKYFNKTSHDTNVVTDQAEIFYEQLLERVRSMPGVVRAGIVSRLPLDTWPHTFAIVGRPRPPEGQAFRADFSEIDPHLFETLGLPLLRGRGFDQRDVAAAPWVAVVNRTFAERYFKDEDPIGKAIRVSIGWGGQPGTFEEPQPRQIVGVVADVTYPSYYNEPQAVIYAPFRQHLGEYGSEDQWIHTGKTLLVRTSGDPLALTRSIQETVVRLDPDQTVNEFRTMEQQIQNVGSVVTSRFLTSLFTAFGFLAVVLAMVGVYGVMSWAVGQRTTEFGVRMALGARHRDIVLMLLAQSFRPILLGVALGVLGGIGLSRVLNSMFWSITTADPIVLAGIATLMIASALAAAWAPLQRVLRLQPQQVLRDE
jgi:putative ABC transport system permease protein